MAIPTGGPAGSYGAAIRDILQDPDSTLENLTALRDCGRREVEEQGDLTGALETLETEIRSRRGFAMPGGSDIPHPGAGGAHLEQLAAFIAQNSSGRAVVVTGDFDALNNPDTSLDELIAHRDQGREVLAAQGELRTALESLDAEIQRRGGT
jgi:hypothetical protein